MAEASSAGGEGAVEQAGQIRKDLAGRAGQTGLGFILETVGSRSLILSNLEDGNQVTFL